MNSAESDDPKHFTPQRGMPAFKRRSAPRRVLKGRVSLGRPGGS